MPKFYHTFSECRNYIVCCEAPNAEAARKFLGNLTTDKCQWATTSYEDLRYYDEQKALDCLGIRERKPDFKCDENGKEIA